MFLLGCYNKSQALQGHSTSSLNVPASSLSLAPLFFAEKAAEIRFRKACAFVCEGESRQVNLLRLRRAHVFILLPQVTKGELTALLWCLCALVFFGGFKGHTAVFLCVSSQTSAGRYYTETGRTLKQWESLKPYSEGIYLSRG